MKTQIIDLSFLIEDGMITYPSKSHTKFESSILGKLDIDGRETRKFTMGSHCGTHVDAPKHFIKGSNSVTDFEVNDLIGEALLINLGELKPGHIISLNDFKEYFLKFKDYNIKRVIFRSDWSRFWNTKQFYVDWPYFEKDSIKFLIDQEIKLLGLDFPSPDSQYFGNDCSLDSPNHKLLFNSNVILVEYLTNLIKIGSGLFYIMVNPLKLKNFDGAPARVTAYKL